ncbi:MAG TPA: hypothetical protein VJ984_03425 [Xanthomonadales bacterium]|nr:hypothetical protein [Xanthomonadales bacterium]
MKYTDKSVIGLIVCSLLLGGCGIFGDKEESEPEYYDAIEADPLKIPDNLDTPTTTSALIIEHQPLPLPTTEMSAVPPRVLANQSTDDGNSIMRWSSEGVYILVDDSPNSVERRLEFVIQRSGMELLGEGGDGGYRFYYEDVRPGVDEGFFEKMAFWRADPPDYSGSYLTLSQPDGTKTRIYLVYADGGEVPVEAAEHVLAILKQRLG